MAIVEPTDADLDAPTTRIDPGQVRAMLPIESTQPLPEDDPTPLAFEEFKLYFDSAERVIERRRDLSRWNYAVVLVLLLAIGVVLNWAAGRASHAFVGVVGVVMLSVVGYAHCSFWIRQIHDFTALAAAKFTVLGEMAPRLRFPDQEFRSYEPFRRESELMPRMRKPAAAEFFMACLFRVNFGLLAAGTVALWLTGGHLSPFR